jgi:hypothetical protein
MVIADVIFLAEVSFLTEATIRPGKPSQKIGIRNGGRTGISLEAYPAGPR